MSGVPVSYFTVAALGRRTRPLQDGQITSSPGHSWPAISKVFWQWMQVTIIGFSMTARHLEGLQAQEHLSLGQHRVELLLLAGIELAPDVGLEPGPEVLHLLHEPLEIGQA